LTLDLGLTYVRIQQREANASALDRAILNVLFGLANRLPVARFPAVKRDA
jgi:hypothetical protein